MYIEFVRPAYLAFFLVIPILIFFHFFTLKNLKGKALKFANFDAIARVKGIDLYSKKKSLLFFDIFFVVLLILALSGLTVFKEVDSSTFSFVIAIDSSQSMSALDFQPDRLSAAKQMAKEFVEELPLETSVGIISFSGSTILHQELTKNKQQLISKIDEIILKPQEGTDFYDLIFNSIKLLDSEKNKAIILLSDGQVNVGSTESAIENAKSEEIIIHTIGVGTIEGGEVDYGISKLDEDSLKGLAYNTGGIYFNAKDTIELEDSFKQLYSLTRKLGKFDLTSYLIIICIILFISKQFLVSVNKVLW
jgi:Ca-activated chloride channel homolog